MILRSSAGAGPLIPAGIIHKFGRSASVGTTFAPVCVGNIYRTPSAATALRVKAGDANDTAAGTGARAVTIFGIDETGAEVSETLATAGASASAATTATFTRLYRAYVSGSGTAFPIPGGSHAADIVIEDAAGTQDWLTIDATDIPKGQSEVGWYTVPAGKRLVLQDVMMHADSSKSVDVVLMQRCGALGTLRTVQNYVGITGALAATFAEPYVFEAGTDIGFMARVTVGTADVSVEFSGLLVEG